MCSKLSPLDDLGAFFLSIGLVTMAIFGVIIPNEALEMNPTHHITRDFIFQSTPRHDLIYNPEYLEIVKNVDLFPLTQATEVLVQLVGRYNDTCRSMYEKTLNISRAKRFTRIPAKHATVMDGVSTCKKLGLKLIELRTNADVASFLEEIDEGTEATPAAVFYEQKTRSFVFFSDHLPVKKQSVIKMTSTGFHVEAYDSWDSYLNHFGRYSVRRAQRYLDFSGADTKCDHFYCQNYQEEEPPDVRSCRANLEFIDDIVATHSQYVNQLRTLLKQGYVHPGRKQHETRQKRANVLLAGAVGGIFGALSADIFSKISPDDKLTAAAKETDRVLDRLGERTSALDINQKRIHTLIEQIQKRLSRSSAMVAYAVELSTTHIQINSVLIHIGDHLSYLYRLLAGSDTDEGINLVLSETEREAVLRLTFNDTKGLKVSPGKPVKHRFQMIEPNILCVIMEVPVKPPITSIAAVKLTSFPVIKHGALWACEPQFHHFLQFSGSYFVEVHADGFLKCIKEGACSGMLPLQYADGSAECHIGQYFGEIDAMCGHSRTSKKRFLLQAANNLAYALLKPLSVRVECKEKTQNQIRFLEGRGVFEIPAGCNVQTNKAILQKPDKSNILIERNSSLLQRAPLRPPLLKMDPFEPLDISFAPKTKIKRKPKIKGVSINFSGALIAAGAGIIILFLIPWFFACHFLHKRFSRQVGDRVTYL